VVAAMVARNRRVSAGLASAYLRAFRAASGLDGNVRVIIPPLAPEQFATGLEVTSKIAAKKSAARGEPESVAMPAALALASGAMARLVLNGGREAITATGQGDPAASGWRWVLGGTAHCEFCRERSGQVFDDSAEFHSHDTCGCYPELVY
jgi:hypothetical protein